MIAAALAAFGLGGLSAQAQSSSSSQPVTPPPVSGEGSTDAPPAPAPGQQPADAPKGTVLFQSHGEPPTVSDEGEANGRKKLTADAPTGQELTDAERTAPVFTAYDLDARLTPAAARLAMRARVTLRNAGETPLSRLALQVSSTLTWESATLVGPGPARTALVLSQHLIDTDADHTGQASEAILTLPTPLAPGQSVVLDTFYSGTLAPSGGRLERINASHQQALATDWDAIARGSVALRGFGNVLWYPVAAPQLFLGDGAQLFDAIGRARLRDETVSIRLRLAVEYAGDPPTAAYFCGRRQPLKPLSDDADSPVATGTGVATAEFAAEPIGFRIPSLFVVERPETLIAPEPMNIPNLAATAAASRAAGASSSSSSAAGAAAAETTAAETPAPAAHNTSGLPDGPPLVAVESDDEGSLPALAASAQRVAPLLEEWLGPRPLSTLTVLDHAGQPFEDGPLLVAPAEALAVSTASPALVHSLTHAWVQTGSAWMDEGLAQFFSLLWTEREQGRSAALTELSNLVQPLSLAEPALTEGQPAPPGQPLVAAGSELYFRRKAAAVWWMLRDLCGDQGLQLALQTWRTRPASTGTAAQDAVAFQSLLEKTSNKPAGDLAWFFNDWVLHDRGLPDLSIVDVTPRELPAGKGHSSGWLVAVTVRNDGGAAADVPLVVRSGSAANTSRLRIPGLGTATARVLVEAAPTEVIVGDGTVPEVRTPVHSRTVVARQ